MVVLAACSGPGPGELTDDQNRYLAELEHIDRRLVEDPAGTFQLAEQVCRELAQGVPPEQVTRNSQRFTGGESVISEEQASRLVAAAREHVCDA